MARRFSRPNRRIQILRICYSYAAPSLSTGRREIVMAKGQMPRKQGKEETEGDKNLKRAAPRRSIRSRRARPRPAKSEQQEELTLRV